MTKTIIAMFDDIVVARQVVEDLVDADFPRASISLITNDANNQYSHYLDKDYVAKDDAVTAGQGAGFGAVVGGLTGVLVGVAALTIPGIGLAIAAGPIAAGLAGLLAGAVTGGVVGALVKSGVPEDEAPYYAEGIRRGGTLISIETDDTLRAEQLINRYGTVNIHERASQWRQAGWEGFNTEENERADKPDPEMLTTVTTDTTITRVTHITHGEKVAPFHSLLEEEPPVNGDDTAKFVIEPTPVDEAAMPILVLDMEPADYEEAAQQMTPDEPVVPPVLPVTPVTEEELRREYRNENAGAQSMNSRRFNE